MTISKATIRSYNLTTAAVESLEEAGCTDATVDADFAGLTPADVANDGERLLSSCLDGADDDRHEGWREYVASLVAAASAKA